MLNLFITGVEQNPSRIFVTAGLAATMQSLGYSTGIFKPVETGTPEKDGFFQSRDLAFIKFTDPFIDTYSLYLLKDNSIPVISALQQNITIDKEVIIKNYVEIQNKNEVLIVDGHSGPATPLAKDFLEEDLIKTLEIPVLFTVNAESKTINNVILSVNRAEDIRGVIIHNSNDSNIKNLPRLIEEYTNAKVLGILPEFSKSINPNDLINETLNGVDIEAVFDINIAKLQDNKWNK